MATYGQIIPRKQKIKTVESLPDFEKDSFQYIRHFPENKIKFFLPVETNLSFQGQSNLEFAFRGDVSHFQKHEVEMDINDDNGNTALHIACYCGHMDLVKEMHRNGAKLNAKNNQGQTPLFVAVISSQSELAIWLANIGADVNIRDNANNHLLHVCACNGSLTVMSHLLRLGLDADVKDAVGRTPLMAACQHGHADVVKVLMKYHANVRLQADTGSNCLMYAALSDKTDIIKMLLQKDNFLAKQPDGNGMSALPLCAQHGSLSTVTALVECGLNMNLEDNQHNDGLKAACEEGHADIVEYLVSLEVSNETLKDAMLVALGAHNPEVVVTLMKRLENCDVLDKNGNSLLILSAFLGDTDCVRNLIHLGVGLNHKNHDGLTALMAAVLKGHEDVVDILILKGADVNVVNNCRITALDLAWIFQHKSIIRKLTEETSVGPSRNVPLLMAERNDAIALKMLSESGYNIHQPYELGITALMIACYSGSNTTVQYLLRNTSSLMESNEFGATAMAYALDANQTEAVDLLIGHGISVSDIDQTGHNMLHSCILENDIDFFNRLILLNFDVNCRTSEGMTPLMLAAQQGADKMVRVLVQHGADVDLVSKDGMDATQYAFINNNQTMANFLQDTKSKHKKPTRISDMLSSIIPSLGQETISTSNDSIISRRILGGGLLSSENLLERIQEQQRGMFSSQNFLEQLEDRQSMLSSMLEGQMSLSLGENAMGLSRVMAACLQDDLDAVQDLVGRGDDMFARDATGDNALTLACMQGNDRIVEFLLRRGHNPNYSDFDGITGLMCACQEGHHAVIDVLLRYKALVNLRDRRSGRSALMAATGNGHESVVRILLEHKAVVDIENFEGITPLAEACLRGMTSIVELLVDNNATIEHVDIHGRTPVTAAAVSGHLHILKYLYSKGAKLDHCCNDGKTPLDFANMTDHGDVVAWISTELRQCCGGHVLGGNDQVSDDPISVGSHDNNSGVSYATSKCILLKEPGETVSRNISQFTSVVVGEVGGELMINTDRCNLSVLKLAVLNENLQTLDELRYTGMFDSNDPVANCDIMYALLQQNNSAMFIEVLHYAQDGRGMVLEMEKPFWHYAIEQNRLDILVILLEMGMDINSKDVPFGDNGLTVALKMGNYEAATLLLSSHVFVPESLILVTGKLL